MQSFGPIYELNVENKSLSSLDCEFESVSEE